MTRPTPLDIPRASYGFQMGVASLVGLATIWGLAVVVFSGSGAEARVALLAFAVGSLCTFVPAVLKIDREHWGVVVLGSGIGRALLALAVSYMLISRDGALAPRPLYMGICGGLLLMVLAETAAAIRILSRIERARAMVRGERSPSSGVPATNQV